LDSGFEDVCGSKLWLQDLCQEEATNKWVVGLFRNSENSVFQAWFLLRVYDLGFCYTLF